MSVYRSGFVSIIGSPNVGKSTLINALVGQKIAIVSERAQTTRHIITGVLTQDGYQIVFLDTPGVMRPRNRLGEYMHRAALRQTKEVEAILLVLDALAGLREQDEALIKRLTGAVPPILAAINKCDAAKEEQVLQIERRLDELGRFSRTLRISARTGHGLPALESTLGSYLTEGPQYFPADMVTDQPERVICCELIREKALALLCEEVPHGVGVSIEKMERREGRDLMDVHAVVYCEREGHKAIIIGKGGRMLKRIGMAARADIEDLLGTPVNLQIWVKTAEDWRNRLSMLRELGYAEH